MSKNESRSDFALLADAIMGRSHSAQQNNAETEVIEDLSAVGKRIMDNAALVTSLREIIEQTDSLLLALSVATAQVDQTHDRWFSARLAGNPLVPALRRLRRDAQRELDFQLIGAPQ